VAGLLILASAWQFRALNTLEGARETAFKNRREWNHRYGAETRRVRRSIGLSAAHGTARAAGDQRRVTAADALSTRLPRG
jgi:hypothetical protein